MTETKIETREQWLQAAVEKMAVAFKVAGYTVPPVQVSTGWPSRSALSKKRRRIGECWDASTAADKRAHIFISPILEIDDLTQGVLPTLVHEVVHAVVGCKAKHGPFFRKCALAVGLKGKMTATEAGPELQESLKTLSASLGAYPHGVLKPGEGKTKKSDNCRMVKCECGTCGYTARTTRKWLDEVGAPLCPCNHQPMSFEIPDELKDKDADDDGGDE
jgi:hypothetical protein